MAIIAPTDIDALPAAPDPDDDQTTFDTEAYAWSAALPAWTTQANALADNVYNNATEALNAANAADASADAADASADAAAASAGAASNSAAAAAASAASATNAANVAGTSTSSVAVATANGQSKTFRYVEASRSISVGMFLVVAVTASPTTNWMLIQVSAWDSVNKDVTGTVITYAGSGTYNAWTLSLSSAPGAFGGTATSTTEFLTGANIASASTVNLDTATGNRTHITGTTPITGWTLTRGPRTVIFDNSLQLTYNATTNRLNSGGANVTVAAGDMAYIESDGTTVYVNVVKKNGAALTSADFPCLHVRDEKSAGTEGGASSSGANERVLNTVVTNTISGASLASNRVTLPAGTYRVEARAPASCNATAVGARHKLILYNVTDAANVIVGSASGVDNSANLSGNVVNVTDSVVRGQFTLAATKTLSLSHYFSSGLAAVGLGKATGSSGVEVYAEAQFWKAG